MISRAVPRRVSSHRRTGNVNMGLCMLQESVAGMTANRAGRAGVAGADSVAKRCRGTQAEYGRCSSRSETDAAAKRGHSRMSSVVRSGCDRNTLCLRSRSSHFPVAGTVSQPRLKVEPRRPSCGERFAGYREPARLPVRVSSCGTRCVNRQVEAEPPRLSVGHSTWVRRFANHTWAQAMAARRGAGSTTPVPE